MAHTGAAARETRGNRPVRGKSVARSQNATGKEVRTTRNSETKRAMKSDQASEFVKEIWQDNEERVVMRGG